MESYVLRETRLLQYDILGLTELCIHNLQKQKRIRNRTWVYSAPAEKKEGKSTDPVAGVAIMLSNRIADKLLDEGHVDTRITWVRIKGSVCNIFYIVTYINLKVRTWSEHSSTRRQKKWDNKLHACNDTYRSKQAGKRPRKLDYICVSNRWKSIVLNVEVRWGSSIHRFAKPFDHGFLSVIWRWKTSKRKKSPTVKFYVHD